jgi:hypothetical protein
VTVRRVSARAREGRPDSARTRTARRLGLNRLERCDESVCARLPRPSWGPGDELEGGLRWGAGTAFPFFSITCGPSWSRSSSARKVAAPIASDVAGSRAVLGSASRPGGPGGAGYRDHPALLRSSRVAQPEHQGRAVSFLEAASPCAQRPATPRTWRKGSPRQKFALFARDFPHVPRSSDPTPGRAS